MHHGYFGSVTSRLDGTGISVADRPG